MATKKRNPQDKTSRNIDPLKREIAKLKSDVKLLKTKQESLSQVTLRLSSILEFIMNSFKLIVGKST